MFVPYFLVICFKFANYINRCTNHFSKTNGTLNMNQLKWFDPKNQTKKKKDYFKLVYLVNRF
jgi:hypothetical protein